jgi:hypothetical protein
MDDEHENISTGMVLLYNCTGPALIILKKYAVNGGRGMRVTEIREFGGSGGWWLEFDIIMIEKHFRPESISCCLW